MENNNLLKMKEIRVKYFKILLVGLGVFLLLVTFKEFIWCNDTVSTDNAYVNANIAQITSLTSGVVKKVNVCDSNVVKKGDVLVIMDDTDALLSLKKAQAGNKKAQADLEKTKVDFNIKKKLFKTKAISLEDYTTALNNYNSAEAELEKTKALLEEANLALSRTVVKSPIDGIVSKRQVQLGQYLIPSVVLMCVVPTHDMYVDANFKEVQLKNIKVGQNVSLYSDLYGSSFTYHGKVMGFDAGTGAAFSLIPPQNATGNWIKVVQRLPVKISLLKEELEKHPLKVGLSMNVTIDTSN